jgi:hypothetical protein
MEDDARKFIQELEEKRGSKIRWKTYSTWYANSKGIKREYGVFLYRTEDSFWFEDFERVPSILGFPIKPKKDAPKYVKYEDMFSVNDVKKTKRVTRDTAERIVFGKLDPQFAKTANAWQRLFSQIVEMVTLADGSIHFFELMDRKQFLAQLSCKGEQ